MAPALGLRVTKQFSLARVLQRTSRPGVSRDKRDGAVEYDDYDLLGRPHTTRSYRYAKGSGLTTAEVRDVHTQNHEWNEFGERTRWRMPAAGNAAQVTEPVSPWRT